MVLSNRKTFPRLPSRLGDFLEIGLDFALDQIENVIVEADFLLDGLLDSAHAVRGLVAHPLLSVFQELLRLTKMMLAIWILAIESRGHLHECTSMRHL